MLALNQVAVTPWCWPTLQAFYVNSMKFKENSEIQAWTVLFATTGLPDSTIKNTLNTEANSISPNKTFYSPFCHLADGHELLTDREGLFLLNVISDNTSSFKPLEIIYGLSSNLPLPISTPPPASSREIIVTAMTSLTSFLISLTRV